MAGQELQWSNPEAYVRGGLINDIDVTFTNCRFGSFTYPGTQTTITAFLADLTDDDNNVSEQTWGTGKDNEPSADGETLITTGTSTNMKTQSNLYQLIESIKKAGVVLSSNKASAINGLKAHVIRVAQPRRPSDAKDAKERDVLVVDPTPGSVKIMPGGKAKAAAAAAGSASTVDVDGRAKELVLQILGKNNGTATLAIIARDVIQLLIKEPKLRPAVQAKVKDKEWMGAQGEFVLDGDQVVAV